MSDPFRPVPGDDGVHFWCGVCGGFRPRSTAYKHARDHRLAARGAGGEPADGALADDEGDEAGAGPSTGGLGGAGGAGGRGSGDSGVGSTARAEIPGAPPAGAPLPAGGAPPAGAAAAGGPCDGAPLDDGEGLDDGGWHEAVAGAPLPLAVAAAAVGGLTDGGPPDAGAGGDGAWSEEVEPSDPGLLYLAGTPPRNLGGFSCESGDSSDAGSEEYGGRFLIQGRGRSATRIRVRRSRSRSYSPPAAVSGSPTRSPSLRAGVGCSDGSPMSLGSSGHSPIAPSGDAAAAAGGRGGAPSGVPRARRGRRAPNVAYYQQHLSTVVAPNNTTLRQLLYGILVIYARDRLPRASVSSMLRLHARTSIEGNLIPTNAKTMLRVLGVQDWRPLERHYCDGKDCEGYVYDVAPRESWADLPDDQCQCPKCQTPRFRTTDRGGRAVLEARAWFIDFGFKDVLASFFADPQFVAAWRQARGELRAAAEPGGAEAGSWAAGTQLNNLRAKIGEAFLDANNINLTMLVDGVQPYNKVTHSTCVVGLVCHDLPPDASARINNVRTLAIVPGPKAPDNLKACILPMLIELRRAAGDPPSAAGAPGFRGPRPIGVLAAEADGAHTPLKTIPYLAGIMADRMAQIKFTGALGPSARKSCHYCSFEGTRSDNAGGRGVTYRPAGYDQRAPQNLDHGGTPMFFDDACLKVNHARNLELTRELTSALGAATSVAARRRLITRFGRKERCIVLDWLWYFDWSDAFIVPVVHALLHNVLGGFLAFALRAPTDGDAAAGTVISREGRRTLVERVDHLISTAAIGRNVKCPLRYPGLYTFEDYKNLALVYGRYLFRGILPPVLEGMYNNLVTAVDHYLTFGNFNNASRAAAQAALREYGKAAERLGPDAVGLLSPSLHVLACRLSGQEDARGEVAADAEYIVERLMQDVKRETSGKRVPTGVEKTVANQQLMRQRERALLRDHHAELGPIEQLLDVEPSADVQQQRNDDREASGPEGARLVGRQRSPTPREKSWLSEHLLPCLSADGDDGWTAAAAKAALDAGRCKIFCRATLGHGAGVIFSEAYGRQRTRNTSHVKVRWAGPSLQDVPHICRVEHYLLLTGPPTPPPGAAAPPLPPLRVAVVVSFEAEPCGPLMWRANADTPAEGGQLWPVRLQEIDCSLLMAAPSKRLSRGELYGIEYTALSRVG